MDKLNQKGSKIAELIEKGREQGYLTYSDVNDHLPDDISDPDQVDEIIGMINDLGLQVHETAPDADTLMLAESENSDDIENYEIGAHLTADMFEVGQYVDVTGTSKGKGYAGVIKRHNFSMQDATHGNSLAHRAHGSIGQCQTPGRVWKGKKMSGHMGNVQKTVQSLKIVDMDVANNVIYIKGAVPGFNGSELKIKPSNKKP